MGIADDLLLLAFDPQRGTIRTGSRLHFSLRSAQLADLVLAGTVTITDGRIGIVSKKRPRAGERVPEIISAIEALAEQTVDELVKRTSSSIGFDCLESLAQEHAILMDLRFAHGYAFRAQSAIAINQVRWVEILARVGHIAGLERPRKARSRPRVQPGESSPEKDRVLACLVYAGGLDKYLYPGRRGRAAREALARVVNQPAGTPSQPAATVDQRRLAAATRSAATAVKTRRQPARGQPPAQPQQDPQIIAAELDQLGRRLVTLLHDEYREWRGTAGPMGSHDGGGAGHGGHVFHDFGGFEGHGDGHV
jgi:Golgi phosphoprotein 3 (GPP34)